MAFIDVLSFGILKGIHVGWFTQAIIFLPILIYISQPLIFLQSLNYEGIAVMNIIWNVLSSVFVTIEGIYIFNEKITHTKMLGIILSLPCMYLLTNGD
jgi:multidrug transporter EmrE-like cation transporter